MDGHLALAGHRPLAASGWEASWSSGRLAFVRHVQTTSTQTRSSLSVWTAATRGGHTCSDCGKLEPAASATKRREGHARAAHARTAAYGHRGDGRAQAQRRAGRGHAAGVDHAGELVLVVKAYQLLRRWRVLGARGDSGQLHGRLPRRQYARNVRRGAPQRSWRQRPHVWRVVPCQISAGMLRQVQGVDKAGRLQQLDFLRLPRLLWPRHGLES